MNAWIILLFGVTTLTEFRQAVTYNGKKSLNKQHHYIIYNNDTDKKETAQKESYLKHLESILIMDNLINGYKVKSTRKNLCLTVR